MSYSYGVATTSDIKTADAQIATMSGQLFGVDIIPPSVGIAEAIIYDSENSNLTGKRVLRILKVNADTPSVHIGPVIPVAFNRGLFVQFVNPSETSRYVVHFGLG